MLHQHGELLHGLVWGEDPGAFRDSALDVHLCANMPEVFCPGTCMVISCELGDGFQKTWYIEGIMRSVEPHTRQRSLRDATCPQSMRRSDIPPLCGALAHSTSLHRLGELFPRREGGLEISHCRNSRSRFLAARSVQITSEPECFLFGGRAGRDIARAMGVRVRASFDFESLPGHKTLCCADVCSSNPLCRRSCRSYKKHFSRIVG